MKKTTICKRILSDFRRNIESESYLKQFCLQGHFSRKRKLSMYQVIMFLFFSGLESMAHSVVRIRKALKPIHFPKVTRQAVSKARQGIDPKLFQDFFHSTVETYYKMLRKKKFWNGFRLFAIDGTRIELPFSDKIMTAFGVHYEKNSSSYYSYAVGSMMYDLLEDIIIDAKIEHSSFSEREAAMQHLLYLEENNLHQNALVIVDRGYFSEKLYRHICSNNYYCLFRIQQKYSIAKTMKSDDEIKDLTILNSKYKEKINIRVIRVLLDSGETEYLVTNIMDKRITPDMFKVLYFERWKIETKYHEIKERHYLEEFTGATPISIKQEFFLKMGMSNLCAMLKSDSDAKLARKKQTEIQYQTNRSFVIGQMKSLVPGILARSEPLKCLNELIEDAVKYKSEIRPGRKYKRRIKKGPKRKHHRNRKTTT